MIFDIKYSQENPQYSMGIKLNNDNSVSFYDAIIGEGIFEFYSPLYDYDNFIITLDYVGKYYPDIYYRIYKHIENNENPIYENIRDYCKSKVNAIRKLKMTN